MKEYDYDLEQVLNRINSERVNFEDEIERFTQLIKQSSTKHEEIIWEKRRSQVYAKIAQMEHDLNEAFFK